jgi:hypothetical protein
LTSLIKQKKILIEMNISLWEGENSTFFQEKKSTWVLKTFSHTSVSFAKPVYLNSNIRSLKYKSVAKSKLVRNSSALTICIRKPWSKEGDSRDSKHCTGTGYRDSYSGLRRPKREGDLSSPSSAEVNNAFSYISTLPISLHGVMLN